MEVIEKAKAYLKKFEWIKGSARCEGLGLVEELLEIAQAQGWKETVEKIGELLEEKPKEPAKDHGYACELINEIWAVIKVKHYSAPIPKQEKET